MVALLAGRNWRALGGTTASAVGLALISLFVFGVETWEAFVRNLPFAMELLKYNSGVWYKMPTVFAASRLLGAGLPLANFFQVIAALLGLAAVTWIWWKRLPLSIRGSGLTLAIFLVTPYAFIYDITLLALPFAWLGWEEISKGSRWGQGILAACWLAMYIPLLIPGKNLYLPALLLMMGFVIYRAAESAETG